MARFTHPLIAYARPAYEGAGAWRTLVGVALVAVFVYVFVKVARLGMAEALLGADGPLLMAEASDLHRPLGVLMTLGAFLAVWPALWLVLPLIHKRPASTLFGPSGKLDWRHFRYGAAVSMAVGAAAWGPVLWDLDGAVDVFPRLGQWALLASFALPLVFVQTAAEELLFRGYLLQQFAARSMSILGWSVLPSLLFGLAHPTESGWLGLSWYHFIFGLVMAAVTSRTANLGAAIGLHFGNNLVNILLVSPAAEVSGLALIEVPEGDLAPRVAYLAMMFVGAALFMGWMDLRFLRQWRAARRAENTPGAREEAPEAIAAE